MVYLQSQLSMSHLACSPLAYNDTKSSSVSTVCFCICHLLLHWSWQMAPPLAICTLSLLMVGRHPCVPDSQQSESCMFGHSLGVLMFQVWRCEVDIAAVATTCSEWPLLLAFLQRRNPAAHPTCDIKALLLTIVKVPLTVSQSRKVQT